MPGAGLGALFAPRSIAVVGASADPAKAGHAMMRSLVGFDGPLYPVNPRATEVLGRQAYPSIAALPTALDLAVLVVPPAAVPAVLTECGEHGVGAAVVCAGGFAESGTEGAELQQRAATIAHRYNIRLLGPNTSGFMRPSAGVFANFMPGVERLGAGPAAFVAQSGGMNLLLSFLAAADGLGLSLGVGLGNSSDVGFADVLDHLADDDATTVVGLHVEGVADGRGLCAAVRRLAARKPVVALKIGRSDVGEFARSHTGALAGDYRVARAALAQAGAVVVDDPTELVDAVRALAGGRLPAGAARGAAVVTGQAGPGLVIADELTSAGVILPALQPATTARLATLLPPLTHQSNPVDTGRPAETFPAVLGAVAADPRIDLVVVHALEEPGAFDPGTALAASTAAGVRTLFATQGPASAVAETAAVLARLAVPTYTAPERAARAARALVADAASAHRLHRTISDGCPACLPDGADPLPPGPVTEDEAKALLRAVGVPVPQLVRCTDRAAAHAALRSLDTTVVVKVLHPDVLHKTEVGGVRTGVRTPADLDDALDAIDRIPLEDPPAYLLEEQAGPGMELIVGAVRDPSFGPVVLLGAGGTSVEIGAPPGLRLAPLSELDADELVASLPAAVLDGFRGQPPLDRAAVADILRRVGDFLLTRPDVDGLEINPLRMTASGPLALDALLTRAAPGHRDDCVPAIPTSAATAGGS